MILYPKCKSTGTIIHLLPVGSRVALCGTRPKRGHWSNAYSFEANPRCKDCWKIKAAREKAKEVRHEN